MQELTSHAFGAKLSAYIEYFQMKLYTFTLE